MIHYTLKLIPIMNLKNNKKNKLKKINMFVFRTNPKGTTLLNSKPCCNCLKYIDNNLEKKVINLIIYIILIVIVI